ncbi:hypothetical protein G5I_08644 [Acromyrmex echinatior]|uniref:Uncharacterized protein n=1 Tax=Acromyrmex echinatior TaxID=103372 RepID=F4WS33_ACREC|nr:hypothetical protein G5I_08644 [Acromyrmex echinatior]
MGYDGKKTTKIRGTAHKSETTGSSIASNMVINVINDLPVGQTLMDHILTGLDLIVLNASLGLNLSDIFNPMSALNYFFFGKAIGLDNGEDFAFECGYEVEGMRFIERLLGEGVDQLKFVDMLFGFDIVINIYSVTCLNEDIVELMPVLIHEARRSAEVFLGAGKEREGGENPGTITIYINIGSRTLNTVLTICRSTVEHGDAGGARDAGAKAEVNQG